MVFSSFLAANFVLPMSKDMLGTDEYFDQVNMHVDVKTSYRLTNC